MYRAGELELARELFATAASRAKAAIAARSMYNRGTTSYAEAVQAMKGASESGQSPADAQKAVIETLERSLRELKDAARADPSNADARANAELAYRVLKELKKQQEQQQQQKQDQQQQDQQQEQKQDDQQQQQNDDSQNQDGKQEPQQEPKNDEQQNDQQQPQNGEQKDGEQQNGEQKQDEQQQEQQTSEADKKPMTKQEVERLLQRIRDKERARILEKLSKERARTKPAPKDW
jgi:Ca-activated chloride channel family protein